MLRARGMRLLGLMLVCLVACEDGRTGQSGFVPPERAPMPPPVFSERDLRAIGSYELIFDGTSDENARASFDNRARLDVEMQGGTLTVIVTPRWGHRHRFTAVRKDQGDAIIAEGGGLGPMFVGPNEKDNWWNLRLEQELDGRLNGFFTAFGLIELGDAKKEKTRDVYIRGWGRIRPDRLGPEIRIAPPLVSRAGKFLPWDPIDIETAEPLRAEPLIAALAKALPERGFQAVDPPVDGTSAERETTRLHGTPRSDITTRSFALSDVEDRSRNALSATPVDIDVHSLDASFAFWGGAAQKNTMIVFPPIDQRTCVVSGAAGYLPSNASVKKLKARVRLRAGDPGGYPTKPKLTNAVLFTASVPITVKGSSLGWGSDAVIARTGSGEMPWESNVEELELALAKEAPADKIGFAFTRPMCDWADTLQMALGTPAEAKVEVEIEKVWTE